MTILQKKYMIGVFISLLTMPMSKRHLSEQQTKRIQQQHARRIAKSKDIILMTVI